MQDSTKDPSQAAEWPEWLEALLLSALKILGPSGRGQHMIGQRKLLYFTWSKRATQQAWGNMTTYFECERVATKDPDKKHTSKVFRFSKSLQSKKAEKHSQLCVLCINIRKVATRYKKLHETSKHFQTAARKRKWCLRHPGDFGMTCDLWLDMTWHDLTWHKDPYMDPYGSTSFSVAHISCDTSAFWLLDVFGCFVV